MLYKTIEVVEMTEDVLANDFGDEGLIRSGDLVTILECFTEPTESYMIEKVTDKGRGALITTVEPHQIRKYHDGSKLRDLSKIATEKTGYKKPDKQNNHDYIESVILQQSDTIDRLSKTLKELKDLDNPEYDGTDFAHPAYWRGHDKTATIFCQYVNEILDGKDDGSGWDYQPWHDTRRRLLNLAPKVPKKDG